VVADFSADAECRADSSGAVDATASLGVEGVSIAGEEFGGGAEEASGFSDAAALGDVAGSGGVGTAEDGLEPCESFTGGFSGERFASAGVAAANMESERDGRKENCGCGIQCK